MSATTDAPAAHVESLTIRTEKYIPTETPRETAAAAWPYSRVHPQAGPAARKVIASATSPMVAANSDSHVGRPARLSTIAATSSRPGKTNGVYLCAWSDSEW